MYASAAAYIQGASRSPFYGLRVWVLGCLYTQDGRMEESHFYDRAMRSAQKRSSSSVIESVNHIIHNDLALGRIS